MERSDDADGRGKDGYRGIKIENGLRMGKNNIESKKGLTLIG
jgi:hypothetical protein